MIYGLLIGLIIAGIRTYASNMDQKNDYRRSEPVLLTRALVRLVSQNVVIVSFITLVGLLIRGA